MLITKLVIDRSMWGAGSLLRPGDGKMCCLGFASKACGATDDEIKGLDFPPPYFIDKYGLPKWMCLSPKFEHLCVDEGLAPPLRATSINDTVHISDSERESELIKLFNYNGIELSFIGVK